MPRFLLKGFASRSEGKTIFSYLYRKGQAAREESIQNINIGKHFYGRDGEPFADPAITEIESGLAIVVDSLRKSTEAAKISDRKIIELVAHLVMRNKNVRDSLQSFMQTMGEGIAAGMSSDAMIRAIIQRVEDSVVDSYEKTAPHFLDEERAMLRDEVRKRFRAEVKYNPDVDLRPEMEKILTDFPVDEKIKRGHNELLSKDVVPEDLVRIYENLSWHIIPVDEPLIIGDSAVVFETNTTRRFKAVDFESDNIINVFFPIATNLLVIGSKFSVIPPFEVRALNVAMAKCAYDFFVAAEDRADMEALSKSIGEWTGIMTKEEIQNETQEMFRGLIEEFTGKS